MFKLLNCDECNCRVNQLNQSFLHEKFYFNKCDRVQILVAVESYCLDKWVKAPSNGQKLEYLAVVITRAKSRFQQLVQIFSFYTKNFETNKRKGA